MVFPIASDHPLLGVVAKIERAKKHISEFHRVKKEYLDNEPFSCEEIESPVPGIHYLVVKDLKPAPRELPLIIGDAIHNLRSVLDLLACQLVKLQTGNDQFRDVSFPITGDLQRFQGNLKNNRITLAGAAVLQVIKELQPYGGGKSQDLWMLHRLNIQDKHRLILVAPVCLYDLRIKSEFIPEFPEAVTNYVVEGANEPSETVLVLNRGVILLRINTLYLSRGQPGNIHINTKGIIDIAFMENGIVHHKSAEAALNHFVNIVVDTVGHFEPFFPPIL